MIGSSHSDYLKEVKKNATRQGVPIKELSHEDLIRLYPYLKMADDDIGLLEETNSGCINPRKLVAAQQKISEQQGCTIINDVVSSINKVIQQDSSAIMKVLTEDGRDITSKAVLVATGAFTTFRQLLLGMEPDQRLRGLEVALVEVDESYAEELQ